MKERKTLNSLLNIVRFIFLMALFASCNSSKKVSSDFEYFANGPTTITAPQREFVIQPNDLLNIQVYSRTLNQEQAAIFNIPPTATAVAQGYQVNASGDIEMPVIGPVKAAGLTKTELQASLVQKLANNVKNPSVLVKFVQFNVNVLGEVRAPGTKTFSTDHVTIIDAISAANDLTDFGRRQDVMIIREEGGKKKYYSIDLRDKAIFNSPVFVMQPNDIVYVRPNRNKLKTLDVNPEFQQKTGLVLTVFSVIVSLTTLVLAFTR